MRTRLIIAFIVVALLSALASAWFINLILPYYYSSLLGWLSGVISGPRQLMHLLYTQSPRVPGHAPMMRYPAPATVVTFFLSAAAVLLAAIAGMAFAASRRVLLPVRRLARAAHRMSGGDLSVRVEPSGRDELAQLVTSFNTMASTLEDKVAELQRMETRARQFAGDVSHELRTPLTAMTAVADILPGHPGLTGDAAAAARLVRQEILHLNRLVEDLIEISRFDAGTAQLVTDDTDVATPVTVTARAEPHGQGSGQLALEVRDHGTGLPEAAIAHVFDRFFKADTARARSEGSGLGLAIAWENAQLHGGHIEAGNQPAGGAVFTASLPLNGDPAITRTVPQPVPAGL